MCLLAISAILRREARESVGEGKLEVEASDPGTKARSS
jgi:hypothetical protein